MRNYWGSSIMEDKEVNEPKEYKYPVGTKFFQEHENTNPKTHDQLRNEYNRDKDKISIELPNNGILVSEFADELADKFSIDNSLFYMSASKEIVEIGQIRLPDGTFVNDGFVNVKSGRFVTITEKYFNPWAKVFYKNGNVEQVRKSMNQITSSIVLQSPNFMDRMPVINRIFPVQMPILYDGKLTFPEPGYDKRFGSWLPHNAPGIENTGMPLEEAKEIIYFMLKEFCFQNHKDFTNAVAALITPYIRGLYSAFNVRSPIFGYLANRERAGKDYLAGVTGYLYEGHALEEPPISDGEQSSNGKNDELRKKLLSAILMGRKRLHFANNKGRLNSAVLEQITTSTTFSDRKLGKNDISVVDNELEFSFSGNLDIRLTSDLINRCRIVRLFLDVEDANARSFSNPNLHGWVKDNRQKVLSAVYALVRNWVDNEMPDGSIPFSSFPEWSKICGGIMECAGYDNPCENDKTETLGVALDNETDEMKTLFELMFVKFGGEKFVNKSEIIDMVRNTTGLFDYFEDFTQRSHQTQFGKKFNRFVGRILSGIRLVVDDQNKRTDKWKYKFTQEKAEKDLNIIFSGKNHQNMGKNRGLGDLGEESPVVNFTTVIKKYKSKENVPNVPKSPLLDSLTKEEVEASGYTKEELSLLNENESLNKTDTIN